MSGFGHIRTDATAYFFVFSEHFFFVFLWHIYICTPFFHSIHVHMLRYFNSFTNFSALWLIDWLMLLFCFLCSHDQISFENFILNYYLNNLDWNHICLYLNQIGFSIKWRTVFQAHFFLHFKLYFKFFFLLISFHLSNHSSCIFILFKRPTYPRKISLLKIIQLSDHILPWPFICCVCMSEKIILIFNRAIDES